MIIIDLLLTLFLWAFGLVVFDLYIEKPSTNALAKLLWFLVCLLFITKVHI